MFRKILILVVCVISLKAEFIGDAGYGYSFYRYSEPGLMKVDGSFLHIFAKLGYLGNSIGIETNYKTSILSSLVYNGSTMNGVPIRGLNTSGDNYWSGEIKIGTRMNFIADNYDGLAYIGFGYRYLKDPIKELGSYTREQIYYYIPVGFYAIEGMGNIGLFARYGAEVSWIFLGVNKTHLGEAIPSLNPYTIDFKQKNGLGMKTHIGLEYRIMDSFKIFTQVFVNYWYLGDSNIKSATYINSSNTLVSASFLEPKNNTFQVSIEFGLGF